MSQDKAPEIHLEAVETRPQPISGVATSTAGMAGVTERGPNEPVLITSFAEFKQQFGGSLSKPRDQRTLASRGAGHWWQFPLTVKGFFDNGGQRLFVKRIARNDPNRLAVDDFVGGIHSLGEIDEIALCLAPGLWSPKVHDALVQQCETARDRFAILDAPQGLDVAGVRRFRRRFHTSFAALYYPWVTVANPVTNRHVQVAPSGHMAGIYARVDREHGVDKASANQTIGGISKIARVVTPVDAGLLAAEGINALRFLRARGNLVEGACTLSSEPEWKYVNIRRLMIFLEDSIDKGTKWVVFVPNNERLWATVRQVVSDFLLSLWKQGVLQGRTPQEAFFVKCDRTTMTQSDLDQGRLVCLIGAAPLKPAEFVIVRIGQWTSDHKDKRV